MKYSEAIADRILSLCNERDITLNMLASLSGLRQSTLYNIVSGNTKSPGIRTLNLVAKGLNIKISQLLDFPLIDEMRYQEDE